ncbi:integrin alpha-2 [Protopterus annectens]|uniref:integrin alpha-2 n=1 Tax=Protopterus annectens TaxID=7888 RepID=UPI001CF942D3|nr:integrin alpha-2 [Protopterus annectens]
MGKAIHKAVSVRSLPLFIQSTVFLLHLCNAYNVGVKEARVYSHRTDSQFGYTVQQFKNKDGKWLLVGSPWNGYPKNRMGEVYKCYPDVSSCSELKLQTGTTIASVNEVKTNMSLGLTLVRNSKTGGVLTCGPLWVQQCASQYYSLGVCSEVGPGLKLQKIFAPTLQTCSSFMDIVIVLDGSNSIWPWPPVQNFLIKLVESLDIGPHSAQVSVIQYGNDPKVEFDLNTYSKKADIVEVAGKIAQKGGDQTNTFRAIDYARLRAYNANVGGREGAAKVMVVVTDGESHDHNLLKTVIDNCEKDRITRFGIAVLGYYLRNEIDTKNLINEIMSIASTPSEKYFFNVSNENVLYTIAGTIGERIFNIEGTGGQGGDTFEMEMSQVGFSAHYEKDVLVLGAVGAYDWSGSVVHQNPGKTYTFPKQAFAKSLEDKNHSSYVGYAVTTLINRAQVHFVTGAPRSKHIGQVLVYTFNNTGSINVIQTQRGEQIGSYFGSVLCSVDVNSDSNTDILLVGAPMYMSDTKKEEGRVYKFVVRQGVLEQRQILQGPQSLENARFGAAISAASDIDMNNFIDVIIGAPLEDEGHGALYLYNGYDTDIETKYSQRILASDIDKKLQYFGQSLDSKEDLNGDSIADVSVGAYGKVVQLWSRGIADVSASPTFTPNKISLVNKNCEISGIQSFCFDIKLCFTAKFRPSITTAEVAILYNITLDADLNMYTVHSRGLFAENKDRSLQKGISVRVTEQCSTHKVYIQEDPTSVTSMGVRVTLSHQKTDDSHVLDKRSSLSTAYSIPYTQDCGEDDICHTDLALRVNQKTVLESSQLPYIISSVNRSVTFAVNLRNNKENAYNANVKATFSKNLFYASSTKPIDGTRVDCQADKFGSVTCSVGYPVFKQGQEVSFEMNFDFNRNNLLNEAEASFTAFSESKEEQSENNMVNISLPVKYDAEIHFTRETSQHFYEVSRDKKIKYTVEKLDDIGPEFNFTLMVATGNAPLVTKAFIKVNLPNITANKNPLLYLSGISVDQESGINCEMNKVNPFKIGQKPHSPSFEEEDLNGIKDLSCHNVECSTFSCTLEDLKQNTKYQVNVTTRIWMGTFAVVRIHFTIPVTITMPEVLEKIPVGVIVGSVFGGLILLAALVAVLWKLGFFQRKYKQMKDMEGPSEDQNLDAADA